MLVFQPSNVETGSDVNLLTKEVSEETGGCVYPIYRITAFAQILGGKGRRNLFLFCFPVFFPHFLGIQTTSGCDKGSKWVVVDFKTKVEILLRFLRDVSHDH
jgi:hypothetical protein